MKPERKKLLQKLIKPEKILKHVDLDKILQAPENQKKTPEEIADEVIDIIAAATPWSVIFPGIGLLIDAVEASLIKAIVHKIIVEAAKKKQKQA
jgi:hypothetical protein